MLNLQDSDDLALFVALVGLAGTVVGALIGFLGTSHATRKQVALQERAARREAYAIHLGSVTEIQRFHSVARKLAQERLSIYEHLTSLRSARQTAHRRRDRLALDSGIAYHEELLRQATTAIDEHTPGFDDALTGLLTSGHRLKITGHPRVHDAAMEIYNWTPFLVERGQSPEEVGTATEALNESLQAFALLARADTQAAGEVSWRVAVAQATPRLAALRDLREVHRPTLDRLLEQPAPSP